LLEENFSGSLGQTRKGLKVKPKGTGRVMDRGKLTHLMERRPMGGVLIDQGKGVRQTGGSHSKKWGKKGGGVKRPS